MKRRYEAQHAAPLQSPGKYHGYMETVENWEFNWHRFHIIRHGFHGLHGKYKSPLSLGKASRGAACCASILPRQEKTPGNPINIFVILLIIIGLCETSLWGAARCASTVARQVPWIHGNRWELKIHSVRISWNLFVRHPMWVEAQRAAPPSQRDRKKRRETQ